MLMGEKVVKIMYSIRELWLSWVGDFSQMRTKTFLLNEVM